MGSIAEGCIAWSRGYVTGYRQGHRRGAGAGHRPWKAKVLAVTLVGTGLLSAAVGVGVGLATAWAGAELFLNTLSGDTPIVKKVISKQAAWNRVHEAMKRAGVNVVLRVSSW